ncbi:hypothetical protein BCR36DRAFT_581241 [Piromyces finnis]|uniref:Protein Zds1 C-terminal domain-containing protein n=1 Tax=Piromyces finnis TaxID=1754191 RepID=A0A1Y1VH83_9FUNG|nr:hypothetical protein BCR36DRAFT_581241 [Piromyces finnis]|eukprot:ORX56097.1 hypothetical protein BCR36DRAFT_581241 [Piromyces finnis]
MANGSKSDSTYNNLKPEGLKKAKKKKSLISLISHKLQKKITKNIVKNFSEISSVTTTKLIKDHSENGDKQRVSFSLEKPPHLNNKHKKEEGETKPLSVPPRYSSNIPARGSSSNYDVNYYNSNLFDKCSLSRSLSKDDKNSSSKLKDNENKKLSIKRSNSDITPSSSTENLLKNSFDIKSNLENKSSAITLVQGSKITITLTEETLNEINNIIPSSELSSSDSSVGESSQPHDSSSVHSYSSKKDKTIENPEKFFFDEKSYSSIEKPIHSERSRKINELFKRDSEKYMDQQLIDLCSTYYKDYYYGKHSESNSSADSDSESIIKIENELEKTNEEICKINEKPVPNDEKHNSDDSCDDESLDSKYIMKSKSSLSYFMPTTNSNSFDSIIKSKTIPVMDSKHISPKIITCLSNDPNEPTTHLVNISGVTIQTNDLNHLYWVPSYLQPEVHPLEFKKLMSTEANSKSNMFGRRLSIRRTKSYAESASVITPENISNNGELIINQIQRHKTFDTIQSLKKNQRANIFNPSKKFLIADGENTAYDNVGKTSSHNATKEVINKRDDDKEVDNVGNKDQMPLPTQNEKIELKLTIDTSPSSLFPETFESNSLNTLPTINPSSSSTLQDLSSIPKEFLSQSENKKEEEKITEENSSKIFLPNADDSVENVPLIYDSFKAENKKENLSIKSGWSLWWSSFGKDDKKEDESPKKSKKSSVGSPKSPFSFFKTKSSTNLADKNINYRQGKGITKAYILTYPLIFKPLTREAEDTIYSLSHTKLATTYRPMIQQVYINNIMQEYIRKYKDAAYKIPFKNIRPPKKRRSLSNQRLKINTLKNQKQLNTPISLVSSNFNLPKPRSDSRKKSRGKRIINQKKLIDLNEPSSTKHLENKEINIKNSKKSKHHSKIKPLGDTFSEKSVKLGNKKLNHSISHDQFDKYNPTSSSPNNKMFNSYDYSSSSSISDDDDDDDEDEIPLAVLKNRRLSVITI